MIKENVIFGSTPYNAANILAKSDHENKTFGENMYNWFRKKYNRVFKRKNKYTILANECDEEI